MTREEAIKRLKEARSTIQPFRYVDEAIDYAIEALGQESILDKIIAEIQNLRNCTCSYSDEVIDDVEDIIDKYKKE